MKVVAISDTHGQHWELTSPGRRIQLPDGDVIVHAGDFSSKGTADQTFDFLRWFASLRRYKHRILISGNHDFMGQDLPEKFGNMIPDNVIYLQDSAVVIDGVKFWGSPWTPQFGRWAFMRGRDEMRRTWSEIPHDTDVLITHGPEHGIGDLCAGGDRAGCPWLGEAIGRRPAIKYHIFGHIHEGAGVYANQDEHTAINASFLDEHYRPAYQPTVFEISR